MLSQVCAWWLAEEATLGSGAGIRLKSRFWIRDALLKISKENPPLDSAIKYTPAKWMQLSINRCWIQQCFPATVILMLWEVWVCAFVSLPLWATLVFISAGFWLPMDKLIDILAVESLQQFQSCRESSLNWPTFTGVGALIESAWFKHTQNAFKVIVFDDD